MHNGSSDVARPSGNRESSAYLSVQRGRKGRWFRFSRTGHAVRKSIPAWWARVVVEPHAHASARTLPVVGGGNRTWRRRGRRRKPPLTIIFDRGKVTTRVLRCADDTTGRYDYRGKARSAGGANPCTVVVVVRAMRETARYACVHRASRAWCVDARRVHDGAMRCESPVPGVYNDPIIKFNSPAGCAIGRGWAILSDSDTPGGSDWSETDAHARRVHPSFPSTPPRPPPQDDIVLLFCSGILQAVTYTPRIYVHYTTLCTAASPFRARPRPRQSPGHRKYAYISFAPPRLRIRIIRTNGAR